MAAISHRPRTRVICRIFIKATPQAVWEAICPELKQAARYAPPTGNGATIGAILEADPPGRLVRAVDAAGQSSSVGSGVLSFELRDTLTGYTALTVSCEPAGAAALPESGTVSAFDWDRLLGDLKTLLEANGRERQRTGPTRPAPLRRRPKLVPQALALSGGQLSPD